MTLCAFRPWWKAKNCSGTDLSLMGLKNGVKLGALYRCVLCTIELYLELCKGYQTGILTKPSERQTITDFRNFFMIKAGLEATKPTRHQKTSYTKKFTTGFMTLSTTVRK